jgi:transcription elongation factor Elf1
MEGSLGYNRYVIEFDFHCPRCEDDRIIVYNLHNESLDCICNNCGHYFEEAL